MSGSIPPTVKAAAEEAGNHEPLYITEHTVAHDFCFPGDFQVNTFPGLLFCQIVVRHDGDRRVVAWWKSRETFAPAWQNQFSELLGKPGALSFDGFQLTHRVRQGRVTWLRPTALVAVVGTAVALITGLSTLKDWGYSLVATPDCTLWTDPLTAAKPKAAGESFAIVVQIKNRSLHASNTATIHPEFDGNALQLLERKIPYSVRIEPGKAEVQEFTFVGLHGGRSTITFNGTQQGGSLRPLRKLLPLEATVDVWDDIDRVPQVSLVKATDRAASISVEVRNAKPTPYGMMFEATLSNPGEVDVLSDKVTIKDAEDPLRNSDFAQLRWRAPPSADVLTAQRFRLVLQEAGPAKRSQQQWNDFVKQLKVSADEPDELSVPKPPK
jgi:hypothetical protein